MHKKDDEILEKLKQTPKHSLNEAKKMELYTALRREGNRLYEHEKKKSRNGPLKVIFASIVTISILVVFTIINLGQLSSPLNLSETSNVNKDNQFPKSYLTFSLQDNNWTARIWSTQAKDWVGNQKDFSLNDIPQKYVSFLNGWIIVSDSEHKLKILTVQDNQIVTKTLWSSPNNMTISSITTSNNNLYWIVRSTNDINLPPYALYKMGLDQKVKSIPIENKHAKQGLRTHLFVDQSNQAWIIGDQTIDAYISPLTFKGKAYHLDYPTFEVSVTKDNRAYFQSAQGKMFYMNLNQLENGIKELSTDKISPYFLISGYDGNSLLLRGSNKADDKVMVFNPKTQNMMQNITGTISAVEPTGDLVTVTTKDNRIVLLKQNVNQLKVVQVNKLELDSNKLISFPIFKE